MRIRNLFTACLLLPALTISAQTNSNVEEKKKEINSIKKNSQYIYAEATAATEQEAKDLAANCLSATERNSGRTYRFPEATCSAASSM